MQLAHQQSEFHDSVVDEALLLSETLPSGLQRSRFSVPGIQCGGCVAKIEKALSAVNGVVSVRANQTRRQVSIDWSIADGLEAALIRMQQLGFTVSLISDSESSKDTLGKRYLRATAVAGFAAGNIMMLSVAVWAGADKITQSLFHTLSAVLAVVAVVYSGSLFFESAWTALKRGRTNMDVPISLGVILSVLLGLYDTHQNGGEVYFEAATMLIFFLLVGRTLDHSMRKRAESSMGSLSRITPRTTLRLAVNEPLVLTAITDRVEVDKVTVGDHLLIPTHARVPVDAILVKGTSEFDTSIVDGEPLPRHFKVGEMLDAGVKNQGDAIIVRAFRDKQHSFLSRTQQLVETVSSTNDRYETLSERVARWYAPVVHSAAIAAGLFWYLLDADLHKAVTIAIAVLIITCPCALGLAVPMVQVLAGGKLFKKGVVMKNGLALERLSAVDTVIFDKTGTLTENSAVIKSDAHLGDVERKILYALAKQSSHPFAQTIAKNEVFLSDQKSGSETESQEPPVTGIQEHPGKGMEGEFNGVRYRFGKLNWAVDAASESKLCSNGSASAFSANGKLITLFEFTEKLRSDALPAVSRLKEEGFQLYVASGDRQPGVATIAGILEIENTLANALPEQKLELVKTLQIGGHQVLMVGDGINDTVALTAADVSIAMGDAGDIAANHADFVLMHNKLSSIHATVHLAKSAKKLVQQNMAIAIAYNVIALPIAFVGWVSPLIAAIAMSSSSLLVVGNSLRLSRLSMNVDTVGAAKPSDVLIFPATSQTS